MDLESIAVGGGVSVVLSVLGFEGTETVAKPRAGLDAGFFFFLLFGGMVGAVFCPSKEHHKISKSSISDKTKNQSVQVRLTGAAEEVGETGTGPGWLSGGECNRSEPPHTKLL